MHPMVVDYRKIQIPGVLQGVCNLTAYLFFRELGFKIRTKLHLFLLTLTVVTVNHCLS